MFTTMFHHLIVLSFCFLCVLSVENNFDNTLVYKIGSSATIKCSSNLDYDHVFMFWHLPKTHIVIGPRNDFDHTKYDYDAVNGNLKIRNLSADDAGTYSCVSEGINKQDIKIRSENLRVIEIFEDDDTLFQSILMICLSVLVSLLIIVGIGYCALYIYQKFQGKCKRIDFDTESGDSANGIYNSTTTTFKSEKEKLYGNNNSSQDEEKTNVPEEKERMYKEEHVDNVD